MTEHTHEWLTCRLGDAVWVRCERGMDILIYQNKVVVTDFNDEHSELGYRPLGRIKINEYN